MKIIALIITLLSLSISAFAKNPGSAEVVSCVKAQLKTYFKNPNEITFSDRNLISVFDDKNFDYVFFILDEAWTSRLSIFVRKGDVANATLWGDGMFPHNVNISSCY